MCGIDTKSQRVDVHCVAYICNSYDKMHLFYDLKNDQGVFNTTNRFRWCVGYKK